MDLSASGHRPPCWPAGQPCPNACAAQVRDLVARNHVKLSGPWAGWRLAGRDLVSPEGIRFSPERLRGLAWRQEAEARLAHIRATHRRPEPLVTVIRVRQNEIGPLAS